MDANGFYAPKGGGPLAWPHTEGDLDWFKYITTGGILVVGKNTYEELLKLPPLKGREIWGVSKDFRLKSVEDVLEEYEKSGNGRTLFICGGCQLWVDFFDHYNQFYLTTLKKSWIDDGVPFDDIDMDTIEDFDCIIEKDKYNVYKLI